MSTLWFQEPAGRRRRARRRAARRRTTSSAGTSTSGSPHDEGERRLQAVLDAGGRLVSDAAAPSFWVVEDADGNRSCICTRARPLTEAGDATSWDSRSTCWDDCHTGLTPEAPGDDGCRMRTEILVRTRRVS